MRVFCRSIGLMRTRDVAQHHPAARDTRASMRARELDLVQLPERINRLRDLAYDLWWSWTPVARNVFRNLDYPLWRQTAHNPVKMLELISPEILEGKLQDPSWLRDYDEAIVRLDQARAAHNTWCESRCPDVSGKSITY